MPTVDADLADLVERARDGDVVALGALLDEVRDDVYNLAIRMLRHPQDAEDATQEILIKAMTGLTGFRGDAAFGTWVYRIAANHILTRRRGRCEVEVSFEAMAEDLTGGFDEPFHAPDVDEQLLAEEVKLGCSHAMLLCLDREHRLAYIVGEVFELPSATAATVLDISPAAYRQRLSRARNRLQAFLRGSCGLVGATAPCKCPRRIGRAISLGRLDPDDLTYAGHPRRAHGAVVAMDELHAAATIFRSHPDYAAPDRLVAEIKRLLTAPPMAHLTELGDPDPPH